MKSAKEEPNSCPLLSEIKINALIGLIFITTMKQDKQQDRHYFTSSTSGCFSNSSSCLAVSRFVFLGDTDLKTAALGLAGMPGFGGTAGFGPTGGLVGEALDGDSLCSGSTGSGDGDSFGDGNDAITGAVTSDD